MRLELEHQGQKLSVSAVPKRDPDIPHPGMCRTKGRGLGPGFKRASHPKGDTNNGLESKNTPKDAFLFTFRHLVTHRSSPIPTSAEGNGHTHEKWFGRGEPS